MEELVISGGRRLQGDIRVSGAKNAALKIMAAALLTEEPVLLSNVPHITDVAVMAEVLRELGAEVTHSAAGVMRIKAGRSLKTKTPYHLVNKMRASIIVLGPLLARLGRAQVAMPGGCNIGSRKIDIHIKGLELMGAVIEAKQGFIEAKAARLRGREILLNFPSVGATENLLMAAVLAAGTTIIDNAAREPEIVDLADCLNKMGAKVTGAGTSTIIIKGVKRLRGVEYEVMPDRVESGTFLVAAAITGGRLFLKNAREDCLRMVIHKLRKVGAAVDCYDDGIEIDGSGPLRAVNISTLPHPGFPTDLQAPFMALLSVAEGTSIITENVFESRFVYLEELRKLGAPVKKKAHHAVVRGPVRLRGCRVEAPDLRGGAALVLAALAADGRTEIGNIYHLDRGYENLEQKLTGVGADISRRPAAARMLVAEEAAADLESQQAINLSRQYLQ